MSEQTARTWDGDHSKSTVGNCAMPFVPAAGVISLEALWDQASQPVENTYHYHVSAAINVALLTGICNTYIAWATANVALRTDNVNLVKCFARDLSSAGGAEVEVTPSSAIVGGNTSGRLPNNVTWAVKRQSGLAGRKNRGRLYWIGISKNQLDISGSGINGGPAGDIVAACDGLLTAQLSDNGATEVILHRNDGTYTPVTSYTFSDQFIDSQRRRLPGHNRHR